MTKILTKAEAARFLLEGDNYCLLTHRRPDGDTLGCAALLCRGLRQLGKTSHILRNPEITEKYAALHTGLTKDAAEETDTLVCVDVASANMLGDWAKAVESRILLRIDHHGTATSFTPYALVDPEAAACGEIIYDVLTEMGATLDEAMAEALYTAVSTDTGCFRYANTTDRTFEVAAACAKVSKRLFAINQELFETNTLSKLRMQAWIAENLKIFGDGKLAIVSIPRAVEDLIGVTEDDMDNISSFPRTVAGVCMAATLRQTKDGDVKISLRSIPGYDSAALCAKFGGGGHKGAAGASSHLSLAEAAKAVEEEMLRM